MSMKEAQAHIAREGIAKSSQYSVFFSGPNDLIPARANTRLTVACEECIFPGKAIYTADLRHYGEMRKYPYAREYANEVTMVFRVGSDFYEKRVFEEWQNMIVNNTTNDHGFYDDYTVMIAINQIRDVGKRSNEERDGIIDRFFDKAKEDILINYGVKTQRSSVEEVRIGDEENVYTCILDKAYPTAIQELPLAHGNSNSYHRIAITFTYHKWRSLPQVSSADLKSDALTDSFEFDDAFGDTQQQANNGLLSNIVRQSGIAYGKIFNRGNGGNNLSF